MRSFVEIVPDSICIHADQKIIKKEDYAIYLKSQDILARAEASASEIIANSEASVKAGYDQGYRDGFEAAHSEQSEAMLSTLQLCRKFLDSQQDEILQLVKLVLQKFLGDLDNDTQLIKLIESSVAVYYNVETARLLVAPAQFEQAKQKIIELLKEYPTLANFEVVSDEKVALGSCILETPIGILNLSLESQLSVIQRSLESHVDFM
ncbi:type III secretion system stator protein SctL [Microbulbifer variabilis]|uniref:type III secretion system stator protein SctL n=1 Tax=Microbulbifer variabilis TaxID=266805 RepID=UPI001CFE201F|nr:type III secretion system stator protein SctL [Microbulbifer variabilis]